MVILERGQIVDRYQSLMNAGVRVPAFIEQLTGISNAPSKVIARNCGIKRILAKPVAGYTLKTTLADELAQRSKGAPVARPAPSAPAAMTVPSDFRILVAEDNSISTKVISSSFCAPGTIRGSAV